MYCTHSMSPADARPQYHASNIADVVLRPCIFYTHTRSDIFAISTMCINIVDIWDVRTVYVAGIHNLHQPQTLAAIAVSPALYLVLQHRPLVSPRVLQGTPLLSLLILCNPPVSVLRLHRPSPVSVLRLPRPLVSPWQLIVSPWQRNPLELTRRRFVLIIYANPTNPFKRL